jgi:3'-phosphoadenosine 5'-phosphosulfate sulfotransferase (PAPS reductase)/FAD synthetase
MAQRHVLGLSGGKDSAALAIFMRERHPEIDIHYFFTDTGKELPEVYEFLGKLEGFLGRRIHQLNPQRTFDFWLREYNNFLPSARTRWCTRQLKLLPFRQWIKPWLDDGDEVVSYVAIRSDEDHREGYSSTHDKLLIKMPLREHGIDKEGVYDILRASGIGLPAYYKWRSRSGCTFCFFQQKIEWVRLKRIHPDFYEDAKRYEKTALEHGSPFTWSQGESLIELEQPERIAEIEADFESRRKRELAARRMNPLRVLPSGDEPDDDIDELYLSDEGNGACLICHK